MTALALACATAGCLDATSDDLALDGEGIDGEDTVAKAIVPPATTPPPPWHRTALTPTAGVARVRRTSATDIVTSRESLLRAVAAGPDRVIWIDGRADIALTETLVLQPGTVLVSDRGSDAGGFLLGARLRTSAVLKPMIQTADRSRISGLRIEGPSDSTDESAPAAVGIGVHSVTDVVVDHNEIQRWPVAGVDVTDHGGRMTASAGLPDIGDNFFHHNQRHERGYGVVVSHGAWARIERNTFNHHRHGVAGGGQQGVGYIVRYNLFLAATHGYWGGTYYGQHVDAHGTGEGGHGGIAGERYDISYNTFAGDQSAYGTDVGTRPAFRLRGAPTRFAAFVFNVCDHDNQDEAVSVSCGVASPCVPVPVVHASSNQYGVTSHDDLAVGDFDGDGRDDVFRGTGAGWWYSSGGETEWRFLQKMSWRTRDLAFADVDGDGETDVIGREADSVFYWSRSGRETIRELAPAPAPIRDVRFGDFNGDGRLDIFRVAGGQWYVWDGATSVESWVNSSSASISSFLFGDFDGVRGTDVVSTVSDQWSISSGARGRWTRLNRKLGALVGAKVADFDDDGRDDIAYLSGNTWQLSSGGRGAGQRMRGASIPEQQLRRITALVGDFDGIGGADAVEYLYLPDVRTSPGRPPETTWRRIPYLGIWHGRGSDAVVRWSRHDMI